jgi:SAM-dependent methyltransferase
MRDGIVATIQTPFARVGFDSNRSGIGISRRMLKHAKSKLGSRATFLQADVQTGLPFRGGSFDSVLMMRVANHLISLDTVLVEVARVLIPGGKLIATDLAEGFDYDCTRIPTPKMAISIETYKHTKTDRQKALHLGGFSALEVSAYRKSDLTNPAAGHLGAKLDGRNTPIFCVAEAIKEGRIGSVKVRKSAGARTAKNQRHPAMAEQA